jgi:hypothetical protein
MLELVRRQVAKRRVKSLGVVEVDDVISDIVNRFQMVGVMALPDALHFQVQKESLHDRVVPAIAFPAHAGNQG